MSQMACALPPLAPSLVVGGRGCTIGDKSSKHNATYRGTSVTQRRGRAVSCDVAVASSRSSSLHKSSSRSPEQRQWRAPSAQRRKGETQATVTSSLEMVEQFASRKGYQQGRTCSKSNMVQEQNEQARALAGIVTSNSTPQQDAGCKYVVQFGNNSGLIRQLMRNRPGWAPAPGDPGSSNGNSSFQEKRVTKLRPAGHSVQEINFLWTQYKSSVFLSAMARRQAGVVVLENDEKTIKLKAPPPSTAVVNIPSSPPLVRIHNHFEGSGWLCTKRGICESMVAFYKFHGLDPFGAIPLTFTVNRNGTSDPEFDRFRLAFDAFKAETRQRMWLVKPGEWGNRGCGIRIYNNLDEIAQRVDSKEKVWAIQKYMEKPFLVHKRKFDIRAYCLVLQEPAGGPLRAFCYRDAYLRTTSAKYTTKSFDRMIHLNNDAVQKNGEDYGKFESANKMSLDEFQRYLDEHHPKDGFRVREQLMCQIRALMSDAVQAVSTRLNPRGIDHCFEVYGFDFMVDASFRVWLIECNANPCLDLCSSYLSHLIPSMLDQALRLTLDRTFSPSRPSKVETQDYGGEGGTKWDPILSSLREREHGYPEASAKWIESLPPCGAGDATIDAQSSLASSCALGRQIACCSRQKHSNATTRMHQELYMQEDLEEDADEPDCGDVIDVQEDNGASDEESFDDDEM